MADRSSEYRIQFFLDNGFMRKKCAVCGEFFWTLDPDRETCGDVECEKEYGFIRSTFPSENWDIHNTISRWIEFFRKRGHSVLDYYPVVARWRDDIYFTIASIALFQPWVTNGIVDPPANPLVVAQPCVRFGGEFSDIDNIGKTGRHLSTFTMGGQHAFLGKNWKGGYWKNRYLELNFEFITKIMKVPPEKLTYKEDWWQGGGNAGPSIETFAYGLEIVNGVFMQYKLSNGRLEPIPIRVLDVGWGLERIAWFMQGTPTIYEATFGPVFNWMIKNLGVEIDAKLMLTYGKYVGAVTTDTEEIFNATRTRLASQLGLSLDDFNRIFGPIESIYAILDHVKTVVMAIPDGGIPANIGGAYNLRTILRRAISLAEGFNFDIDWEELIHRIIDYFSKTFHRVKSVRDIAPDIWMLETKKFRETLEKAIRELRRTIKKKKIRVIDDKILKNFYLNYGMPPEQIESIVRKMGLDVIVKISPSFYDEIKNVAPKPVEEGQKMEEHVLPDEIIQQLQPTKPLYYDDPYMAQFQAKILYAINKYVILDQTAFYPMGGGQLSDHGVIQIGNERYNVVNVFKIRDVIIHELDRPLNNAKKGIKIMGQIDWNRRISLMRHHTATHIINGAAQRVLGPHVWQMGAEKKPEKAHLDISHYKNLSYDEIRKIEDLANRIVLENRPVILKFMARTEAEKKYGVGIYQGGAVPASILRIVEIKDWDVEACGGTHLTQTILTGPIKIIGTKKIHDGVVRIEFVAGSEAIKLIGERDKYLRDACDVLRVQPESLPKVVERFFVEWKRQKDEITKLWKFIANNLEKLVADKVVIKNNIKFLLTRIDVDIRLLFGPIRKLQSYADNILIVGTVLGEHRFIGIGDAGFIKNIKDAVSELSGEARFSENIVFGSLNAPADNLIVKIKRLYQIP